MNARIVAFIACRLLSLYVGLNYVTAALIVLIQAAVSYFGSDHWLYILGEVIGVLAYGALSLFFWFGAGWVADRVVKPLDAVAGKANVDAVKALAIATAGGLCMLTAARVVGMTFSKSTQDLLHTGQLRPFDIVLEAGFFLVTGLMLIGCSSVIVRGLNALRNLRGRPFDGGEVS